MISYPDVPYDNALTQEELARWAASSLSWKISKVYCLTGGKLTNGLSTSGYREQPVIPEPLIHKLCCRFISWDWTPQMYILISCDFLKRPTPAEKRHFLDEEGLRITLAFEPENRYLKCCYAYNDLGSSPKSVALLVLGSWLGFWFQDCFPHCWLNFKSY